jgi:DNA replication protein DnaC
MNAAFARFIDPSVTPETDAEIVERRIKAQREAFAKSREEYFERVCPSEYRAYSREKCRHPESHDAVVALIASGKSCIVSGAVGSGKTFAVWHALRDLIMRGVNPMVYSGVAFTARSSEAFSADDRAVDWLDFVYAAATLVIDDWAKEAVTEAQERAFFEIIERRSSNDRQTVLVTSRTARDILDQQRASNRDTGRTADILRRIAQRFQPIKFGV